MKKRPISIAKGTINIKNLLDLLHAFEVWRKLLNNLSKRGNNVYPFMCLLHLFQPFLLIFSLLTVTHYIYAYKTFLLERRDDVS